MGPFIYLPVLCLSVLCISLTFVSVHIPFILCLSMCLSFSYLCLSHHSHTHTWSLTQSKFNSYWLNGEPETPARSPVRANLFLPAWLRNARSGAAAGAPETLQSCLPSVEAESGNNEKLSVNFRFLPPALLRTGSFAFSLDANSPTRCKAKYWFPCITGLGPWNGPVFFFFILCKGKTRRFVLQISPGTGEGEGELAAE